MKTIDYFYTSHVSSHASVTLSCDRLLGLIMISVLGEKINFDLQANQNLEPNSRKRFLAVTSCIRFYSPPPSFSTSTDLCSQICLRFAIFVW